MRTDAERVIGTSVTLAILLLVLTTSSCGYALSGQGVYLPNHIRTVAVPLLDNRTYEYQLASNLTSELTDQFSLHKEISMASAEEADAVLEGKILEYSFQPVRVDRGGTAQTYRITIRAELVFRDLVEGEVYWENPSYAYSEDYDVPPDIGAREQTEQEAREEVVRDMAADVVGQILEGF